jgi:hypothetical protein
MKSNPEMSGDADFRNPGSQESGFFYAQDFESMLNHGFSIPSGCARNVLNR